MIKIAALWRHPIKGHGREALGSLDLEAGATIPWDRRWAVAHEASRIDVTAWEPCANFSRGSKVPALMGINASSDMDKGTVTLSHPERPDLTFDPDGDASEFLDWVKPLMPEDRAQSARIIRVEGRGMTDTDYPSVSLINLASNADLADKLGEDISPLRWRCNIHLEGAAAWEEFDWIGKTLALGSAELAIREPILRCRATMANPTTGQIDIDTLKGLNSHYDHQDFGIYAEVTKSGQVQIGDTAQVI